MEFADLLFQQSDIASGCQGCYLNILIIFYNLQGLRADGAGRT
mgnify:CR=1 FL=1